MPQPQAVTLSPLGHAAFIAPSPPRQQGHADPSTDAATSDSGERGPIKAQLIAVSPGTD
jgi:hypothetical protein